MSKFRAVACVCVAAFAGLLGTGGASAALMNYVVTGDVVIGDEFFANAFGLTAGDTVTATGVFDDSVLTGGSGTVSFGSGSGNTMTLNIGTATFTAADDDDFLTGSPSLTFSAFSLSDFDFVKSTPDSFNSSFLIFDDFGDMVGQWRSDVSITPVPVPAAAWLFGSGLLGFAGIARRRQIA